MTEAYEEELVRGIDELGTRDPFVRVLPVRGNMSVERGIGAAVIVSGSDVAERSPGYRSRWGCELMMPERLVSLVVLTRSSHALTDQVDCSTFSIDGRWYVHPVD